MQVVKSNVVSQVRRIHEFYCDDCGCLVGTSHEYEDGYYEQPGRCVYKVYLGGNWLIKEATFCDDCGNKFEHALKSTLINLGFGREEN